MRKLITTATLTALALSGFAAASAVEPASTTIRSGDFISALTDTRATGHVEFLRNGLHVFTDGNANTGPNPDGGIYNTDKAAEYFDIGDAFPTRAAYEWSYLSPSSSTVQPLNQPGAQIFFDTDADPANAGSFNVLVGEQVYSTNPAGTNLTDFWLTGPAGDGQARALANGYVCPRTTGGSGSNCHGTLAEWNSALTVGGKTPRVYAGGFSLGSGVKGDGILRTMTFGGNVFEFTSVPEAQDGTDGTDGATGPQGPAGATGTQGPAGPVATTGTTGTTGTAGSGGSGASGAQDVTGTVTGKVKPRKVKLVFATDKLLAGSVQGKSLIWKVKVDGALASRVVQRAGERDVWIRPFGAGKHVVKVTNNAGKMQKFKLTVK